jgi:hypothetical protein
MRNYVFTWWGGLVRDSFGSASVFRCARIGSLRRRRRSASGSDGGVARRERRPTAAAALGSTYRIASAHGKY